jgi:hypothetical protein
MYITTYKHILSNIETYKYKQPPIKIDLYKFNMYHPQFQPKYTSNYPPYISGKNIEEYWSINSLYENSNK